MDREQVLKFLDEGSGFDTDWGGSVSCALEDFIDWLYDEGYIIIHG